MTKTAFLTLLSYWRRSPGQFVTLVLGLMLATALWSGVQALNAQARQSYAQASEIMAQTILTRLVEPSGRDISIADFAALRRAGFLVSPVIDREEDGLRILGVDPLTAPPGAIPAGIVSGGSDFTLMTGEQPIVFLRAGTQPPDWADEAQVLTSDALPPDTILADIATIVRLTGINTLDYFLLHPEQPAGLPAIETATELLTQSPDEQTDLGDLTGSFHLNLTAFGLLSFGVGLFITYGAVGLAFENRRPVFRTLRAVGLPLRRLIALLALELGSLALVAGLLGVALGYVIAASLLPGVSATLRGLYGAPVPGELAFDPLWALAALAVSFLGAGLAGAQSLLRVAQMPLLAPAQPRAWAVIDARAQRRRLGLALAAIGFGALATWLGEGLIWGFAGLAGLLGGAALGLPSFLAAALNAVSGRAKVPFTEWMIADARQQVPGLSFALMALMLALSANIGVSTMVGSFRATFIEWIDQRLFAEIYVRADDQAEADRIEAIIAPQVDAVLRSAWVERAVLGQPAEFQGISDHPTQPVEWPLLSGEPEAWAHVGAGEALVISEQLAHRTGLGIGDTVPFAPNQALPVAGIYADYGNPKGQITLNYALLINAYPETPQSRLSLRVASEDVEATIQTLRDQGLRQDQIIDQTSLQAVSLRIFEQTFLVTGALNILTLSVAALALLTSFLTLGGMRLPQIAPVWALGQTRRRLALTELWRAVGLAVLTFIYALPVGLALAWILLAVINVEAFGWRLPMVLFPFDWARLLVLSLIAAALAALWPTLKLARIAPARLLQVFAYER
ncbi:MAG: FtsX-like permease family protein [Pseudomonadota bacterium]